MPGAGLSLSPCWCLAHSDQEGLDPPLSQQILWPNTQKPAPRRKKVGAPDSQWWQLSRSSRKPVLKGKELEKGTKESLECGWRALCSLCLYLAHSCKSPSSQGNSLVALGNWLCLSELWGKKAIKQPCSPLMAVESVQAAESIQAADVCNGHTEKLLSQCCVKTK